MTGDAGQLWRMPCQSGEASVSLGSEWEWGRQPRRSRWAVWEPSGLGWWRGRGGRQGYCGRDFVSGCAGLAWPVFAKGGS